MSESLPPGRPRHEHLSIWLREQIASDSYTVHDQLPSENQLGKQFGVSRITVRRALQTLENEGLIYRRQGLGSFVADTKVGQGLVRLTDFVEDMTQAGLAPSSRVTFHDDVEAPVVVSDALHVDAGAAVRRLDRLRLGNGAPIAFDRTWLPHFYAKRLDGHDLEQATIYSILEQTHNIPVVQGRFRIEAVNATEELAMLLDVPVGQALLMISRISETHGGHVVYYQQRFYRSDRVAYELTLARAPGRPLSGGGLPLQDFEPVYTTDAPYDASA